MRYHMMLLRIAAEWNNALKALLGAMVLSDKHTAKERAMLAIKPLSHDGYGDKPHQLCWPLATVTMEVGTKYPDTPPQTNVCQH